MTAPTDQSASALLDRIDSSSVRGRLMPNFRMADVTWFRTGGPAELLFQPADVDDLSAFLRMLPPDVPVTVVGIGSNLLVRDGGMGGVVVRLSAKGFGQIDRIDDSTLRVGAACPDKRVAAKALEAGIGGFHFLHGIPGSIGGALRMNAGANGVETRERVVSVHAVGRDGEQIDIPLDEMAYRYRGSGASSDLIFTGATMRGELADRNEIQAAMDAVQHHRETSQPIREKTGGSTFKNPPGHSAWKLVDEAGCRGLRVGGAQMSEMHCNFMINTGEATSEDLERLGETVRSRVLATSGVKLDWEIKRIGEFADKPVEQFLGIAA